MNIFQNELHKLLHNNELLTEQKFTGNVLFGRLTDDTVLKAEFVTCGIADHHEAIRLQVINRREGAVDSTLIKFSDIVPRPDHKYPYIWKYSNEDIKWYGQKPSASEYKTLREHIDNYIETFADLEPTHDVGMKMGM